MSTLGAVLLVTASSSALACFDASEERAYLIAPDGDDQRGDGGPHAPWQSLERAQLAMREGPTRRTYLREGRYRLAKTLMLDGRDDGAAFVACPNERPVLDGASAGLQTLVQAVRVESVTLSGLEFEGGNGPDGAINLFQSAGLRLQRNRLRQHGIGIVLAGSSRNTISANVVEQSSETGIELKEGSDDNRVSDNMVEGTQTIATHGGGIFVHGGSRNRIERNLVQHTLGAGIVVSNWDDATINLGTVIAHNVVRDVNQASTDSGAIYILGRSHVDTQSCVAGNIVDGTGGGGDAHTIGIYLDDSTSGVTVEFNRLRHIGSHAVEIHGGDDIIVRNNAFDLRSGTGNAVLFQAAPADTNPANTMRGNVVAANLVLMDGMARPAYSFIDGGAPTIAGNVYVAPADWDRIPALPDDAKLFADMTRSAATDDLLLMWTVPAEVARETCAGAR